jgi:colicin import membrane protein
MWLSDSKEIKQSFYLSFILHFALIFLAILGPKIFFNTFGNSDIEIIKSGMPKFTVKELRELQKLNPSQSTEQAKKEETVAKSEKPQEDKIKENDLVMKEATKEQSKKSFLNLISNYSSKKIEEKKGSKGKGLQGKSTDLDSLVIEGNRISKGSALVGDYSDEEISAFSGYVQSLPEVIRKFWKLPSYLIDQNLKCRIRIFLSSKGELIKLEVHESSGQSEFDSRAEQAIRSAAPYFPAPEQEISSRVASSGIILGFPL